MTEHINIVPEGTLSVWVCVCVCLSVCVSLEALAPKRQDRYQRHSGFEVGQRFASDVTAAIL